MKPPDFLHWDLWLGVPPPRPYGLGYHPFAWRGWWDFGSGALGDMACHTVNMPYMAVAIKDPTSVVAETSGHNRESFPSWSIINFEFPANEKRGPLKMVWYDGKKQPSYELFEDIALQIDEKGDEEKAPAKSGALIIGDKGKLLLQATMPSKLCGFLLISRTESGMGAFARHFHEFVDAIKGGPTPVSNFPDYSGPLTETILLGNLAVWAAQKLAGARKLNGMQRIWWRPMHPKSCRSSSQRIRRAILCSGGKLIVDVSAFQTCECVNAAVAHQCHSGLLPFRLVRICRRKRSGRCGRFGIARL